MARPFSPPPMSRAMRQPERHQSRQRPDKLLPHALAVTVVDQISTPAPDSCGAQMGGLTCPGQPMITGQPVEPRHAIGRRGTQPTVCLPPSAELSLFLFNDPSFESEGIGYRNLGTLAGSPQGRSAGSRSLPNSHSPWRRPRCNSKSTKQARGSENTPMSLACGHHGF